MAEEQTNSPRKLIRRKQLKLLTGNPSDSTIWRWVQAGTFPAPIQIGEGSVGWWEDEILEWQASRLRAGRRSHLRGHGRQRRASDGAAQDAAD